MIQVSHHLETVRQGARGPTGAVHRAVDYVRRRTMSSLSQAQARPDARLPSLRRPVKR